MQYNRTPVSRSIVFLFVIAFTLLAAEHAKAQTDSAARSDSAVTNRGILRGKVISQQSREPILHARVSITGTKLGAITNDAGDYRVKDVPVGHYTIKVSAAGFSQSTQEIVIGSAHQAVLDFALSESSYQSDTVTVTGSSALAPINHVAAISVNPFSIEDVNRYAAAFKDPSRMAENFAGVYGKGSTNNYIVVRGGSPIELLWRLDGIDIPDPNHFGKNGSSGGLISAINSAVLGNSDFFSGAFPAEYGTRMSAVFDLHTRDGNSERTEGRAEISLNGIEAGAEGPIPGIAGSSYLASYRHSTLAVLRSIGVLNYTDLPDFDDASLKLNIPLTLHDNLSATGLWGTAKLNTDNTSGSQFGSGSGILVGGLDWQHLFSDQLIGNVRVNYVENRYDEAHNSVMQETTVGYATAKSELAYIPTQSQEFKVGVTAQRATYHIVDPSYSVDTAIGSNIYQAYINWNWHLVPELVLNSGVYSQFMRYDSASSFEPRLSLAWSPTEQHSFAVAFGVHRQPEPFQFSQALHYVAGYTFRPEADVMFKVEAYLKKYSDIPVHASELDDYSFLNEGLANSIDFNDLVSKGVGRTYGAEFTFLKHYASGYYVTTTASLVRQEFAGSDNIWHFGAFDNRYIFNVVSGYDIPLSASSVLTLSEKFTLAGGGAYTAIDLARSQLARHEVLDTANAYGSRNSPYVRVDLNAEFKFNWSSTALTIYASVLNALNIKNVTYHNLDFDPSGHAFIREEYDLPLLPIVGIRFEF